MTAVAAGSGRAGLIGVALSPVLVFVVTSVTGYAEPMFANPPGIVGLPLGVVLLFLAAALTALALLAATRSRPPRMGWTPVLAFALPALVLVALGPALIRGMF